VCITLHRTHLAHALGQPQRVLECYRVVSHLAEDDAFVGVFARAGEVAMWHGMRRGNDGVASRTEDCLSIAIFSASTLYCNSGQ
jgi:hypothetical protein